MAEKREAIFEDKEEVCMEEACDVEEAIEQFDEKAFYVEEDSPLRSCSETSEVSDEDYKQLVDDINRLAVRNVQIIAIFTDKNAIKDVVKNRLSGNMVEEYLNNEATLHTLLDRIQTINISSHHGENFENSKFGPVSKRMSAN